VPLNDHGEFEVDYDGAMNLIGILANDLIERSDQRETKPSDQIRTLLNLGTVSLRKANTGYWEKTMTIADALYEAGIQDVIDRPDVLKELARQYERYGSPTATNLQNGVPLEKKDTPGVRKLERIFETMREEADAAAWQVGR
jgi:hypothetical protein